MVLASSDLAGLIYQIEDIVLCSSIHSHNTLCSRNVFDLLAHDDLQKWWYCSFICLHWTTKSCFPHSILIPMFCFCIFFFPPFYRNDIVPIPTGSFPWFSAHPILEMLSSSEEESEDRSPPCVLVGFVSSLYFRNSQSKWNICSMSSYNN